MPDPECPTCLLLESLNILMSAPSPLPLIGCGAVSFSKLSESAKPAKGAKSSYLEAVSGHETTYSIDRAAEYGHVRIQRPREVSKRPKVETC